MNRDTDDAGAPAISVYGAPWCPHCKRVKKFFAAHRVPYAYVDIDEQPFVFIGLDPNTAFLGPTLERDARGFLVTDATMQTSLAGVFAAGDVRAGSTKQLGSAVGDGIAALLMTRRYLEQHRQIAARANG